MLNTYFHSQFNKDHRLIKKSTHRTCTPPKIDTRGIAKLIQELKPGKAPSPDSIRKEDLMADIDQAAYFLTTIFNKSLEMGTLAAEWKTANVSPIHKADKQRGQETTG